MAQIAAQLREEFKAALIQAEQQAESIARLLLEVSQRHTRVSRRVTGMRRHVRSRAACCPRWRKSQRSPFVPTRIPPAIICEMAGSIPSSGARRDGAFGDDDTWRCAGHLAERVGGTQRRCAMAAGR